MQILNTNNLTELRKQVQKIKKEEPTEVLAVLSQDDDFNRKALEIKGINILVINEELNKRDYSKQRDSSLNEVLAKIAHDKDITIAIDIEKIIKKPDTEKAKSLARLRQNIMLCKKAGAKLMFLSENNKLDKRNLQSLLLSLGASTNQAKQAQE